MLRLRQPTREVLHTPAPKVLLVRPDHVGDVILTTPAIQRLRDALPEARLSLMVGPWSEEVARRDSLLDEVIVCPFPGFTRARKHSPWEPYRLLLSVASELSMRRYDAALILRFDHWWGALLSAVAGIRVRVGCGIDESRPFLNYLAARASYGHWTMRSLAVVDCFLEVWARGAGAGCNSPLRFEFREEDDRIVEHVWGGVFRSSTKRPIALHPGAGAPIKGWPAANWSELGRNLSASGAPILVTGSSSERGLAEKVAEEVPGARSLAGQTSLGVLSAVYRRCGLIVGVDSGPMHLAVAVDTPSVRLHGPTDVEVYGPWGDPQRHLSIISKNPISPCNRLDLFPQDGESPACMRSITVDQVAFACRHLLESTRS